jgi:ATP-dependent 26S proteasome regulatory subunit
MYLLKVEKAPLESYADIGGLQDQVNTIMLIKIMMKFNLIIYNGVQVTETVLHT